MTAAYWYLSHITKEMDGSTWSQFSLINCANAAKAEKIGTVLGSVITPITVSQASFLALLGIQIRRE